MSITETPSNFSNLCTGRLSNKIGTTTATGITVTADTYKTPAGTASVTWNTGPQIWKLTRKTRTNTEVEFIGVESLTQTGTAITTGAVIRYLSMTDGNDLTSKGNGLTFPAGTIVELVWSVQHAESTPFKNAANIFTALQTFSAGIDVTGKYIKSPVFADATARDAAITSPANGMVCYVTGVGLQFYSGGSWNTVGSATVFNASTTVAGIVELSTGAERGASTATGGTGAALVVSNDALVKTSSGAGDENKLPVLNSTGKLASGFLSDITGDGSDGALNVASGTTTIDLLGQSIFILNYADVTISGGTLAFSNPASNGTLVIIKTLGDFNHSGGTIDMTNCGSSGGAAVSLNGDVTGQYTSNGNDATDPYNTNGILLTRNGKKGLFFNNSTNSTHGYGASGGANCLNGALAATSGGEATSTGITDNMLVCINNSIIIGPGAGGGSGGCAISNNSLGGTMRAASGAGGRGGGGLLIVCGGTYTFTGTVNLSGANAAASTITYSPGGGAWSWSACSAGGSGGGAAGCGAAIARSFGALTGTKTLIGGLKSINVNQKGGSGTSNGSDGTDGAAGEFHVGVLY